MPKAALLFDFGGTLDADGLPWVDRFFQLYHRAGGTADEAQFCHAFAATDAALARTPGISSFGYSATVEAQARLLGEALPRGAKLDWQAISATFTQDALRAARRNRPTLMRLAEQYPLAVVSNYQGNLGPCLDELGLSEFFRVQSDSGVLGVRKPDPRIFTDTLDELGAEASRSWMIGDSPPNDISAAMALGLLTCWIAPARRALPGILPTARISQLDELPDTLMASCTP